MAVFSGKDGSLTFAGTSVARVRNWSFTGNVDAMETTNLGVAARRYEPGLKSATGQASVFYHDDNDSLKNTLDNCITTGAPAKGEMQLKWDDKLLKFTCIVTSVAITCSTGEVMSADISFTMDGDYTTTTL